MALPPHPTAPATGNFGPEPPDIYLCDAVYGTNLVIADCHQAMHALRSRYPLTAYHPDYFPLAASAGTCHLTVELGGPSAPPVIPLSLGNRRSVAALGLFLITRCLIMAGGVGGFATWGMARLGQYTTRDAVNYFDDTFPPSTYFLTVTLSGSSKRYKPGDTDPVIPSTLSNFQRLWLGVHPSSRSSLAYRSHQLNEEIWKSQAAKLVRGGSDTWYDFGPLDSNQMKYECDASLGSPLEVDCTQIEWHQLYPASDTLTVGPTTTTFFHSNTCYLAISATLAITLTWAQIRTALAALMNICVQHPTQTPKGGRAYFTTSHKTSGRGKRDAKLTGLNALPPHANITIFQQFEPWVNPTAELDSCTWKAVKSGQAVTTCHKS